MIDSAKDLTDQLIAFRETHEWRQIRCTGLDWYFLATESGSPALVLLAGGGGSAEDMFELMTALEDQYRVIAISCPDEASNVHDVVQGISAVMEDQRVTSATLLGHSLGGMFAECFMLRYPEKTDALILANVAHYGTFREVLVRGCIAILPYLPRPWVNRQAGAAVRRLLARSPAADFWIPFLEWEIINLGQVGLVNRLSCMLGALDVVPTKGIDLDGWNRPVLMIETDDETGFTETERAALRRLYPKSQSHLLHRAGHMSPYTQTTEFVAAVRDFMGGPEPSPEPQRIVL